MPARHEPLGDAVPHRLSPWFSLAGLVLLATLLAAGFVQARQYALLKLTVEAQDDYLVISLYQVEIEYLRLREQLRKDEALPASSAMQLRYDIFVSRVGLLGSDRAQRLLAQSSAGPALLKAFDDFVHFADMYLGPQPRGTLSPSAAKALLTSLEALDEPIHQLMLDATHRVAAQVTERQAQAHNHNQIGLALTGCLLAVVLVFGGVALRQMRQVDERRQRLALLAEQLRDARIEAEAASEAKSGFLADMSHELRTPLHSLLGMVSLLRDSPRDPHAAEWLATADDSARHLERLLDDILDLSKLESGALSLVPGPVSLTALLREVQTLLQPAAAAKGLALHAELDPALPAQVLLDGTRVRQVLFNLLANAVKYSDAGAIVLQCRQRLADGLPAQIEFDVTDTGIGMDPDTVARLFQRFSRADDARSRRQGGAGLGLAISRNLARLMDGEILVRSTPGAGSVFTFRCPLHPSAEAPASQAPTLRQSGQPLRVLVAEDHPVNRLYMAALLTRLGHQSLEVDNGLAAVQAVQGAATGAGELPFDLVLMDVHMPQLDGVAATRAIRALPGAAGQVCVVALTADGFADTRERCLAAGVTEVATKPLSLGALRLILARHFGEAQALDAPSGVLPLLQPLAGSSPELPGLIDHATVQGVRELMGADELRALYTGFFVQADDAARRMREAMREADTEALRRNAHTVKGAALNLGLSALADAAARLNRDAAILSPPQLALALHRSEETLAATRALCTSEGLLT
jgi:signal transduction histidine kinase/CheY-like chemotaxis protein